MRVVACEKCGAKYQIDDNETINGYECSICAGNLKEIEGDSFVYSSINQNHSNNLYSSQYNSNSQIVYCENCGLKHTLDKGEYAENYECSSCFGNLRYVDESLNKDLEKRLKLKQNQPNTNFNTDSNLNNNINSNTNTNTDFNTDSNLNNINSNTNTNSNTNLNANTKNKAIQNKKNKKNKNKKNKNKNNKNNKNIHESGATSNPIPQSKTNSPSIANNVNENDKKLRAQIKSEFFDNLANEYVNNDKIVEENSDISIFDKISNLRKKRKNKTETHDKKTLEKEISELNNPSKASPIESGTIDNKKSEKNRKHELVPYPNIKNTSYHDVYIIVGLIIALIGFTDIISSQRIYSIIFIAIGFVLFIVGIIKNKGHTATEKRGRIIREKLLGLPENFYVLYYVKVPNSNYGINHVVVGASGIFSIVSQSYGEKEDKEKPKTDAENLNLVNKSKLDDFDLLGISNLVEEANNNYENNKKKNEETSVEVEKKRKKIGKFKFRETPLKFDHNNKIKQKSIHLSEELIDFLNENGLTNFYVEPLVGFVNNDVAVINMPLTDEDLFLDELLYRIIHGKRQLDDISTHKIAVLLSQYSTECSS